MAGWLKQNKQTRFLDGQELKDAFFHISDPLYIVEKDGRIQGATDGEACLGDGASDSREGLRLLAVVPASLPENLGDRSFCKDHGFKYPLVGGSMAHGISSADIVEALGKNDMMAFFGAAGLSLSNVEAAIDRISQNIPDRPYGFNLIHSPNESKLEAALVDLYLRREVRCVEASAFLNVTLPLIKYRVHGIHRDSEGNIVAPNFVVGKISRVEVAAKFFAPPPDKMLQELVRAGDITPEQAQLAAQIPVASDVTAEADSGGHTDNRPAITLLPTILALRDRMQKESAYEQPLRVGLGGGISTPLSTAAAFAMGAAWVMTGTVNQACVESGVSPAAREMLLTAQQADVAMAPAGDMFEMGVTVQVLKRGTMFAMRAAKLYELYRSCKSIDEIPAAERANLEKNMFKDTLENIWASTRSFFQKRDPEQIVAADKDPKHKMALIFRWYLGQSPRWAVTGDPIRKVDFQIWCGPAMGAFNEWAKGTFLEKLENRQMVTVARNLLWGACVVNRLNAARQQGVVLPSEFFAVPPFPPEKVNPYFT